MLKYPGVHVSMAGGKIILEGMVENQYERTRAELIASSYGTVTNLLQMRHPKQVRIESRVIEISTDKVKNLGIAFGNAANKSKDSDGVSLGTEGSFGLGQSHSNNVDTGNPFNWFGSYAEINAQLNALVKKGDAKVLSEPYVIAMSGEKANILIGGEIPVPVNTDDNAVTIEWREYDKIRQYAVESSVKEETKENNNEAEGEEEGEEAQEVPEPQGPQIDFDALKAVNPDVVGWMSPNMKMETVGGAVPSYPLRHNSSLPLSCPGNLHGRYSYLRQMPPSRIRR